MMKSVLIIILVSALGVLPAAPSIAAAVRSDAIEPTANGTINWTNGEISASGIGAPPAFPANAAQARGMAERAAFVVALRNLLETVKGVRVDSETVVENFLVKSDVIRTRVDGIVKGARIVNKQYLSDGSVEITVSINMRGAFMNAVVPDTFGKRSTTMMHPSPQPQKPAGVKPSQPAQKVETPTAVPVPQKKTDQPGDPAKPASSAPAKAEQPSDSPAAVPQKTQDIKPAVSAQPESPVPPPAPLKNSGSQPATLDFKGGTATGVVIDGRGLGLRPALLPRIFDQQGQEVYVGQVVPRTNAVEQGVAGYARDVNAASGNFRVTDNPAVIRGLNASGAAKTDIVIAQADADALRKLSSNTDFLQYCRVIIVY